MMGSAQGRAGRRSGFLSGLFGSGKSLIGLSIGASSTKAVEIKTKGNGWVFGSFESSPVEGALSDQREIINPSSVTESIRDVFSRAKISNKEVCAAVTGSGVIIKTLTLSITNMKELNDQVIWEAEQYIPFDISDVVVDFQVLRKLKDNQVEVIIVAVKKDFLDQYRSVIESAKLKINVFDVEMFALQNCFEMNYDPPLNQSVLLADIGAMSTKMVICSEGVPLFTKDSPYGGSLVSLEIQRELRLPSIMDAEALKISGNLPQEVAEIVSRTSHTIGAELKKSLDFYNASSVGPPVSVVFLSGGASRASGLVQVVAEYVGTPVDFLNPFERVEANPKRHAPEFLETIAREVVIPMGLAMRSRDSK
ncbi:MAG: type IV pilus assembly protein PilM [Bdellovibrionales bacterium]|nr:type IV pilus assembly protein PilM [Bdellovibrionales bacterium]